MRRTRVKATVFLGGGRITSALIAGLRLAGYRRSIVVHDHHSKKLLELRLQYGVATEPDLGRAIAKAKLLIVAVRPASVVPLLDAIGGVDRPLPAVSLAAGIPLALLRTHLKPPVRWARAMPSPVCRIGRGLTALTFERRFPVSARREVQTFFAQVGAVLKIPESQFDAFTVTYSSSHGYHALAALAEAAIKLGLERRSAYAAAAHALADGITCWREEKVPLKRLLQEAATPGGTAATVMEAMNSAGHARVIERGLRAGLAKARANAKR
jgi:pyrroline-5-carboxylate reductase